MIHNIIFILLAIVFIVTSFVSIGFIEEKFRNSYQSKEYNQNNPLERMKSTLHFYWHHQWGTKIIGAIVILLIGFVFYKIAMVLRNFNF